MLTLGVNKGDYILIGPDIVVQVVKVGEQCRLAIEAPREMKIERAKLHEDGGEAPACILRVRERKQPPKAFVFKRRP